MTPTLRLAMDLIARASVTPEDAGCQELIRARLEALGFECESLVFGEVTNLWARSAEVALAADRADNFYRAKLNTARFFVKRVLPQSSTLAACIMAGG